MAASIAYPLYPGKQAQGDSEDLVFGTRRSRIDNPNNILRRQVFPASDRLEIPHATWLTFRRRWATWADNEHVGARTIADIMGHEKVGTRFIYTQSSKEMKRVAADRTGIPVCKS